MYLFGDEIYSELRIPGFLSIYGWGWGYYIYRGPLESKINNLFYTNKRKEMIEHMNYITKNILLFYLKYWIC